MKSIIFIFPSSQLGGAERIMFNLAKHLNSINYEVVLFILSNGRNPILDAYSKESNIRVVYCDSCNDKNLFSYKKLFATIKINNFDFIFTSHIITNALLSLFLKTSKINSKLISRESTVPFERFFGFKLFIIKFLYKFLYGKQSLIIYQTQFMKESLFNNLGFYPAKNNVVIQNSIDIYDIESKIKSSKIEKQDLNLTFIACGRFITLKNFDVLLSAYSEFIKNYNGKSLLYLLGDGPEMQNLKKICSKLGLNNNVIFTGKVDNPASFFSISDIGIITSQVEGFPNVVLEMMYSGVKQVISTPCTPAIYDLPNILITDGFSENDILNAFYFSIEENRDFSVKYKEYIRDNRTIFSFWNDVIKATSNNS